MIYADHLLACRLESLIATEFRRLAALASKVFPGKGPECVEIGDGVALWLGQDSPVNLAVALGMQHPVTPEEFDRLEVFYHDRGAPAIMSMCPLADASVMHLLGRRGWVVTEFEHLLVLELKGTVPVTHADGKDYEVRVCQPEEREIWGRVAARGFAGGEPAAGHDEFGRLMAERDDAILVLAWVDGEPAGTGALVVDGGVGWLSADTTLPRFQRRGIQQALQRHRIELAGRVGCDLAVTEAAPGGQSQRNMERLGFRIAFTHVEFTKPV